MAGGGVEVELKLSADDDAALDDLAAVDALGPASLGTGRTVTELDSYLDTADGRLASARWACRLRSRENRRWVSLKGPPQHGPGEPVHRRAELEGPIGDPQRPAGWPPSPARELVLRLAGGAPLTERLALRQRRTEREVTADGARVATLTLDRVQVLHAGRPIGDMRVVELELAASGAALDPAIVDALLQRPRLRLEPASKLERALEMINA